MAFFIFVIMVITSISVACRFTGRGLNNPPVECLPFIQEMKQKDPELYEAIGHMTILEGVLEWRKKCPEDFTDLNASIAARGSVKL